MKKLMIAAAIVCAAAFAQAAQCDWYTSDISGYNGASSDGYLALFFESATVSQADAEAALAQGSFTFTSNGFADDPVSDNEAYGTTTTHSAGDTVTGYMIVFNAADTGSATHYYMTEEGSGLIGAQGQNAALNLDASDTAVAKNWTKIGGEEPIPEPTSGLLMLLGMGALALRRRRA